MVNVKELGLGSVNLLIIALGLSSNAQAEMLPLNDDNLSRHVGQIKQVPQDFNSDLSPALLFKSTDAPVQSLQSQGSSNSLPSSGITMDIDLQLHIDEIRWVDVDGAGVNGTQGAIVLKGLSVGHLDGPTPQPAPIRGVTFDVDGRDGLRIGIEQIGDQFGNGIDVNIESVQIR